MENQQEKQVQQRPERIAAPGRKRDYTQLQQAPRAQLFVVIQGDDEQDIREENRKGTRGRSQRCRPKRIGTQAAKISGSPLSLALTKPIPCSSPATSIQLSSKHSQEAQEEDSPREKKV